MDEVARLLMLLAIAGGALTLAGGIAAWSMDEVRRVRATLRGGLGADLEPWLAARGRGMGVGLNLAQGRIAVAWDRGAWRLVYRLEELVGVELIVDRRIAARAFRNEPRRGLDSLDEAQERVRLRFVFDDPAYPDFELDLWRAEDMGRRGRLTADAAIDEANRWMARMDALLRRPTPPARPVASLPPPVVDAPFDEEPPFDLDIDEEDLDGVDRAVIN